MGTLERFSASKENMTKVVYLFPDTNVFVLCETLEQLDWSEWREDSFTQAAFRQS
jgi:hypothetical protein